MIRSVTIGLIVLAITLIRSHVEGFGLADEAWFLQVVSRVRSGEALYRDVFYGATPLAVYLTASLSFLAGVEILIVKLVTNATFAVTTVLAERLVRRTGSASSMSWIVAGVLLVWGRPYANPPYTPLAMAFFVATLTATFATATEYGGGRRSQPCTRIEWAAIGGWAGLSFAAKQNVGLLALMAALIAMAAGARDRRRLAVRAGFIVAGFIVPVVVVLLPVLMDGGLPALWEYGFAGKGAYVRLGGVSYIDSLSGWIHQIGRLPAPSAALELAHGLVLILPVAVVLFAAHRWQRLDTANAVLIVFSAAAVAAAYPRWDRFHMAYAVPVLLVTLISLQSTAMRAAPAIRRSLVRLSPIITILLFGMVLGPLVAAYAGGDTREVSMLPHFRGPWVTSETARYLAESAHSLAQASGKRPTLVLSTDAGFWYLTSGLNNPTPFDVPSVTSVGRPGVSSLLTQLSTGHLDQVCLDNRRRDLALLEVEAYIRTHFLPGPDVGPCTMYRMDYADSRAAQGPRLGNPPARAMMEASGCESPRSGVVQCFLSSPNMSEE